ncbi:hypothetical protein GALL_158330 [mine drainage metagenome]|uniref:Uncharacterized protein n=1 Tax=mine drainage metagenome TaxID=410659 RepID=A0A1J5SDD1_9ZZZZ
MAEKLDTSTVHKTGTSASAESAIDFLDQASKRGVTTLMPYLWTLVFIISILALTLTHGLDWWTAGLGALVTVSLLIVLFVVRQIVDAPRTEVQSLGIAAMWFFTVLFAASLSLLVSSVFFGHPLNLRPSQTLTPTQDEGWLVIQQFYKLIDNGDFNAAWNLVHKKRKDEIRTKNPNFDWEDFARAYTTTRQHSHLQIERIQHQTPFETGRTYRVSFAVRDELPVNHLYRSRPTLVKEWFDNRSLDRDKIVGIVISDVKNQFEVPRKLEPMVVEFVGTRRFESLFKPDLIFNIGRELKLTARKAPSASPDTVCVEVHVNLTHVVH